jgi:hypothetical protein
VIEIRGYARAFFRFFGNLGGMHRYECGRGACGVHSGAALALIILVLCQHHADLPRKPHRLIAAT